jgi:hypothetical protein
MARLRDTAFGLGCQPFAHPNRQHASAASNLASRSTGAALAMRFDRLVRAILRLICAVRCGATVIRVSTFKTALQCRRHPPDRSPDDRVPIFAVQWTMAWHWPSSRAGERVCSLDRRNPEKPRGLTLGFASRLIEVPAMLSEQP